MKATMNGLLSEDGDFVNVGLGHREKRGGEGESASLGRTSGVECK
jgi:hypothetical protein